MRALHLLPLIALPLVACAPPVREPGLTGGETLTLIRQSTQSQCGVVPTAKSALAVIAALYPGPRVIVTGVAAEAADEICAALFGASDGPPVRSGPPPASGAILTGETALGVPVEAEFVGNPAAASG